MRGPGPAGSGPGRYGTAPSRLEVDAIARPAAAFLSTRPTWLRVQHYLLGTVLGALAIRLATDRSKVALSTP